MFYCSGLTPNAALFYHYLYGLSENSKNAIDRLFSTSQQGSLTGFDICMALEYFQIPKKTAVEAINRSKGVIERVSGGLPCKSCKSTNTYCQMTQFKSGDEGAEILVTCNSCGANSVLR